MGKDVKDRWGEKLIEFKTARGAAAELLVGFTHRSRSYLMTTSQSRVAFCVCPPNRRCGRQTDWCRSKRCRVKRAIKSAAIDEEYGHYDAPPASSRCPAYGCGP
jgi:hypothetical protein